MLLRIWIRFHFSARYTLIKEQKDEQNNLLQEQNHSV